MTAIPMGASSSPPSTTNPDQELPLADPILAELTRLQLAVDRHALVAVTDPAGIITHANDQFCRVSGYSRDELIGETHRIVNSGFHSRQFWENMWQTISNGDVWHGDVCNRTKSGSVYWVDTTIVPFKNAQGKISQYVAVRSDITDQHAIRIDIEQTRRKLQAVINASTHVSIISTDPDGLIRIFNTGAERMLGYTAEEMVGKLTPTVIHLESEVRQRGAELSRELGRKIEGFDVFVENARQGRHEEREWTYVRKNGSHLTVNLVVTPIQDADDVISGFLGVAIDVSEHRRAQEARAAEQKRLMAFVEHAPAAIAMFDRDLRYIAVSRRWMIDYRLEGQSIIGRSHYDVFPQIPQRWKDIHARCLAGNVERNDDDAWQPSGQNRYQHLRWEVRPWYVQDDQIGGIIMFTEDITVLKETAAALHESRERFELAVRGSSDGIWDWNIRTNEAYYSPRFRQLLGYDEQELPNEPRAFDRFLHPEDAQQVHHAVAQHLRDGTPFDVIFRLIHKSGSWRWFRARGEAIRDERGRPFRMIGSSSDITSLKEAELNLAEQAKVLALARDQAEAANRFKTAFVANMSHEIRTPMTAILGYVDLLTDPTLTDATRESHIATIKQAGEHLLTVINDILDLSKIEAGKMIVEMISLSPVDLVREVLTLFETAARDKGIELKSHFDGPIPRFVQSDPVRIRQILVNLIGNAMKFTSQGSITLVVKLVTAADPTDARLAFEVHDTGIGMTDEQISELFQPFMQADVSTTRKFGGTGLGLTICLRLAHLLGGDVTATAAPGQGSTFVATIAAGPFDQLELLDSPGDVSPAKSIDDIAAQDDHCLTGRILLVEDTLVNQRLVHHMLTSRGAAVDVADNGRIAVEMVLRTIQPGSLTPSPACYDVILMDMQMPELDGYAATRILREQGYTGAIVALTAHAMADDRQKCLDAGCNDHLSKPIDRRQLFSICQRYQSGQITGSATVESSAAESVPVSNVVDIDKLFDLIDGDLELLAELTALFVDSSTKLVEQGRAALANNDFAQLKGVSHTLRGSTGVLSGQRAHTVADRLERICLTDHPEDAIETWQELEREITDLRGALSKLSVSHPNSKPTSPA